MDARIYWIWMQLALGAACPQVGPLLRMYGSAQAVYDTSEEELRQSGLSKAQCHRLSDKDLTAARDCLHKTLQMGGWVLTPDDARFPSQLRGIYAMPLVLYGRGNMPDLEHTPSVTVVGTRDCSAYGARMASRLAAGLTAGGLCIVSGGAVGIDETALRMALRCGGTTVCVQGCGLDVNYPAYNEDMRKEVLKRGAVITEYVLGTPGYARNFPVRNRLLSGLTNGTCVVEAPVDSGALITARYALEQGRDVFAVPGSAQMPNSAGCNKLIQEGAHLIADAVDVLMEYRPRFGTQLHLEAAREAQAEFDRRYTPPHAPKQTVLKVADAASPSKPKTKKTTMKNVSVSKTQENTATGAFCPCPDDASDDARRVYGCLKPEPQPVDELAALAQLPMHQTLAALTELEIAGCACGAAGGQYRLKESM